MTTERTDFADVTKFFFSVRKNKIKIKRNKMDQMIETSSALEQLSQGLLQ